MADMTAFFDALCTPEKLARAPEMTPEEHRSRLWRVIVDGLALYFERFGAEATPMRKEEMRAFLEYGREMGYI